MDDPYEDPKVQKSINGWVVVASTGEIIQEFKTNAEAYAWVDRHHRRPLWKKAKADFWGR